MSVDGQNRACDRGVATRGSVFRIFCVGEEVILGALMVLYELRSLRYENEYGLMRRCARRRLMGLMLRAVRSSRLKLE